MFLWHFVSDDHMHVTPANDDHISVTPVNEDQNNVTAANDDDNIYHIYPGSVSYISRKLYKLVYRRI